MPATDAQPIRPGEELDLEALREYLRGALGAVDELTLLQFPGGHSNLTYLLTLDGREYVLRRPPHGPLPPRAHDMAREFRLLESISPWFAPAPRPVLLCEDEAVLGVPFYLMERRRGVIPRRETPVEYSGNSDFPRLASEAFIDCLAELHSVDIYGHGLDSIGKPEGFLERQVRGWSSRWERARTSEIPEMEQLSAWLTREIPDSPRATLVHNDYKLDNLVLAADDPGRVVAVLDWEMATVGDPLVDLGIVMCYWPQRDDPLARREAISPLTTEPGWMSRRELLARYHKKTGRPVDGMAYYEVFGLFKLAVVLQQIYYRYHVGQTQDERFRDFELRVRGLAESAVIVMENTA